jgi:hypothetical protein
MKEQTTDPGKCAGWAIVVYDTKEQLDQALKTKKFILKCKNRSAVITLKPYMKPEWHPSVPATSETNTVSQTEKTTKLQPKHLNFRPKHLRGNEIPNGTKPTPKKNTSTPTARLRQRRNIIKSWIKTGTITKELGEKYLEDCKRELEILKNTKTTIGEESGKTGSTPVLCPTQPQLFQQQLPQGHPINIAFDELPSYYPHVYVHQPPTSQSSTAPTTPAPLFPFHQYFPYFPSPPLWYSTTPYNFNNPPMWHPSSPPGVAPSSSPSYSTTIIPPKSSEVNETFEK